MPEDKSVNKIASVLEDVSIKDVKGKPLAFNLTPSVNQESLSSIDRKTIQLLELLDQYQILIEKLSLGYTNGFLTLSRANYNSGITKKYGPDSFDYRPYNACKTIEVNEDFKLNELLPKPQKKIKKNDKTTEDPNTLKSSDIQLKSNNDTGALKNRHLKKKIEKEETTEIDNVEVRDPIYQFGGLVPYQLRQSQDYFSAVVNDSIRLVNLKNKINRIVEEMDSFKET